MDNTQEQPASSYLVALLGTGARPFAYRNGVYKLLGRTPPHQKVMRGAPPLPPVGFHYALPDFEPGPGEAINADADTKDTVDATDTMAAPRLAYREHAARRTVAESSPADSQVERSLSKTTPVQNATNEAVEVENKPTFDAAKPLLADPPLRSKLSMRPEQESFNNTSGDDALFGRGIPKTSWSRAAGAPQSGDVSTDLPSGKVKAIRTKRSPVDVIEQGQTHAGESPVAASFKSDTAGVFRGASMSDRSMLNAATNYQHLPAAVEQIMQRPVSTFEGTTPVSAQPEMAQKEMRQQTNGLEVEAGEFRFAALQRRTPALPSRSEGNENVSRQKNGAVQAKHVEQPVPARSLPSVPQPIQEVVYVQSPSEAIHQSPRAAKASSKLRSRHLRTLR